MSCVKGTRRPLWIYPGLHQVFDKAFQQRSTPKSLGEAKAQCCHSQSFWLVLTDKAYLSDSLYPAGSLPFKALSCNKS